ncbi:MAG TPA: siderophore-interacting protein [Pseudonocardiaceae bacterium]|jgi:NADPH-dependent ferric siderophore reductase|nr:siderophore-interacting protein [Pseudonocardiaceae bacterium]
MGPETRRRVAGTVARVHSVQALTPRMTRVRLVGESLRGLGAVPGQAVKIYVPDLVTGQPVSRDYTVRDYRDVPAGPYLDIDFVLHGSGPAANWARHTQPGQTLEFVGPSGRYRPDPSADWHLFAGDESALPAIQAYAGMLPAPAQVCVYVEVPDVAEQQPIPGPARCTVHWLHRATAAAGTSTVLPDALRAVELPPGRGQIWIAGHTPTVRRIRTHLLDERGIDRRALYVKGYWDRAAHWRAP